MGCCFSAESTCNPCQGEICLNLFGGHEASRKMEMRRMFDLVFGTIVPGLAILQLLMIASRGDSIDFHSKYEMPPMVSWYYTFFPSFLLIAYLLTVVCMWSRAIPSMTSEGRRSIYWSLVLFLFVGCIAVGASLVLLVENLNVKTHNFHVLILHRHGKTLGSHDGAQNDTLLALFSDEEVNVLTDPDMFQPLPHSYFLVVAPLVGYLMFGLFFALAHFTSDSSKRWTLADIFCAPTSSVLTNLASSVGGYMEEEDPEYV